MSTFTIFLILIIFVAFLLIVVIMVQNPKGGGLSSSFGGGGSTQMGGVQKNHRFFGQVYMDPWRFITCVNFTIKHSSCWKH